MNNPALELRMYFFVPYNISPIQQGIQAGHAALEYAHIYGDTDLFKEFVKNHKTWVILNGGTTNNQFELGTGKPLGGLNQINEDLLTNKIPRGYFQEPDLNEALTAVCFICDERVFNKKDYPDFVDYLIQTFKLEDDFIHRTQLRVETLENLKSTYTKTYNDWLEFIGGTKNLFLRELITGKKKA